jgi:hypothetical protein
MGIKNGVLHSPPPSKGTLSSMFSASQQHLAMPSSFSLFNNVFLFLVWSLSQTLAFQQYMPTTISNNMHIKTISCINISLLFIIQKEIYISTQYLSMQFMDLHPYGCHIYLAHCFP